MMLLLERTWFFFFLLFAWCFSVAAFVPGSNMQAESQQQQQQQQQQRAPFVGLHAESSSWWSTPSSAPTTRRRTRTRRRELFHRAILMWTTTTTTTTMAPAGGFAAETIGKDENCTDRSCLGVWDGLLADCPHDGGLSIGGAGCVSSQDDTPGNFAEPWDYADTDSLEWEVQMSRLVPALERVTAERGDALTIAMQQGRYLRVEITDGKTREVSTGEFYFTPSDTTVQFRMAGLSGGSGAALASQRNMDRAEAIRKDLGFLKLPVLRNRKRTLLFVESDLDTFGPGSASLGPPSEMNNGRVDDTDADRSLTIDLLQNFPQQPKQ